MNSQKIKVDQSRKEREVKGGAGTAGAAGFFDAADGRSVRSHRLAIVVLLMGAFLPPLGLLHCAILALPAIREGLRATG